MLKEKIKRSVAGIKFYLIDHYHILFKSAAVNHLRIQKVLKNPDGSYQLTVRFGSYSELKEYQKKLRRLTVSLSSAVAMVVVAFIVAPYIMNPSRSSASTFQWTQGSWTTKDQTKVGIYPTDNSNTITNFYDSSGVMINGSSDVTLTTPAPSTVTDNSYTGGTGFYRSDANGVYSASGSALALKKVQQSICADTNECATGTCTNAYSTTSKCCVDACCGTASITDVRGTETIIYPTVAIGSYCWMAENLRTSKKPDGSAVSALVNPTSGGGSPWGYLYTWTAAMNGAAASTASGAQIQGICPSGWHIPGNYNNSGDELDGLISASGSNTGVLKRTESTYWTYSATGGNTNSSGFGAVANGYYFASAYSNRLSEAYFWTSAASSAGTNPANAYFFRMNYSTTSFTRTTLASTSGMSLRCIKNKD